MSNINSDLILIVDDNPNNIQVVATIISENGYELGIAMNAIEAYKFLEENIPELILLDVDMPEIDGFEVCSTLKKSSKYKDIPIIFLTVQDEKDDIVKAFDLGAVDYVTKPFNRKELVSRVRTHISLKKTKDELKKKNLELERTLEMKDEFLSIISHEFRTPLNVISSAIQAMNYICCNELSDKAKKYLRMIRQNTFRQLRLVNNLLDITRVNAGRIKINKKNVDIVFLTKSIIESIYTYVALKSIDVTFVSLIEKKIIGIDDEKYERILLNLLSNATKFTPEGKPIIVTLSSINDKICVEVKDKGIGIPEDKANIIFERFGQVDSSLSRQAEGAGIGLSLVKKFVEALGGSISVKSELGKGSTFTILLPSETIIEDYMDKEVVNLLDNRLVQNTKIEFSDIYL
ncbi:hybrid sensor histidine kinase/response regulator [Clostridium beijerinckii]|uniref:hybrid sensor histidine kinase/response regulator n=1 Tax=Clostridium beijerinckii TaxID=1520 RepID=UPI0009C44187|nr:hybrid sensor histidine kinase/response regulator [Clostridium beijerinckii]NRT80297.1 two-component system sensor histidine kinase/response regulator [Clostridium beijerinckii]OOM45188.1 sensor histidine kinase TodS [Clostridium beijerinckii]